MKVQSLVLLFSVIAVTVNAQKNIPEYKASNGITYHVGDTIKLGRGSAPNGDFRYVQVMGLATNTVNQEANNLPKTYSGGNAVIKRVALWKRKGAEKIYLVVGVGLLSNYWISVEDAIATCEVAICKGKDGPVAPPAPDKYDQLKKLKDLLDQGIIDQEEYDKEKKKILEG